nr:NS1 [Chaphamaparvovirus carnivoran1]
MQAEMERSGRSIIGIRRFTWSGDNLILEKEENIQLDKNQLTHQLHIMNAQTWQAGVLSITYPNGSSPLSDPLPYVKCFASLRSVKAWILAGEYNPEGIFHVHSMALTLQRSDSFRRSIDREWFVKRVEFLQSFSDRDPVLDVLKMQKCHKPESLIAYMCKEPIWICTSDKHYTNIVTAVCYYDLGERFRIKQQEKIERERANSANMNKIVADVLNVIYDHSCKTIEDCMKCAPDIMSQYLHRSGFSSIVQNCLTFVSATAHGWSLERIACKHFPHPDNIHKCLLHQGLDVCTFDISFFKWITKQMSKHNTLVLWGPSNTGKSAFISGFKQCVSWGEIVNTNNFAFEGLMNNNIGVWEEPLISPELAEKAKQIFEGMECSIPVKFKKPIKLPRTPIIMTTNHAPWRFCTHEEEMFRNRMFIFYWNFDMANTELIFRNSNESCECCSCKRSCGRETSVNIEPTSRMQGEQQSLQLAGSTNNTSSIWPRSLSRTGTGALGGGTTAESTNCRSDNQRYCSNTGRAEEQCSHSSGSSISSCTSVSDGIRTSGYNRSSDPSFGISGTQSGNVIDVVSDQYRRDDGIDFRRDRMGSNGNGNQTEGYSDTGRVSGQYASESEMVVLGKRKKTAEAEIQTKKFSMDRKMESLTIPTKIDWFMYLSYLQQQYG